MYLPGIEEAVERMKKERRGSQPRIKEEYIEDPFLKNLTGFIGLIYGELMNDRSRNRMLCIRS